MTGTGYRRRMPRKLRLQAADVVYHVGSRGVEKRPIFGVLEHDRGFFLSLLAKVVRKHEWLCHAYCLMGNHFHLVVETPKENLSDGMQLLKGDYAQWFNANAEREGALFERRFWSEAATDEGYLYNMARYVALNPVRVGWARTPERWPWSSYAATVGLSAPPPFLAVDSLLAWFGGPADGKVRFAQFVGEGLADWSRTDTSGV